MIGKSIYKAGKLLKITLDYDSDSGRINSVNIEGDFFVYPEEGREKIEKALHGTALEKGALMHRINETLTKEKIDAYGFDATQLSEAIMLACTPAPKV